MTTELIATGTGAISENLKAELSLEGDIVKLEPLSLQHVDGLIDAASSGNLWELAYTGVPQAHEMQGMVEKALEARDQGSEFPFAVLLKETSEVVGTTRYYNVEPVHRNLSIGYTWYAQKVHRTGVNTQCKYLLLQHAFDVMQCISVQWHTDHRNKRSQEAIKRLGAKFEGVLRNNQIRPNGVIRHTHCFSMIDTEWPDAKAFLESRMAHFLAK